MADTTVFDDAHTGLSDIFDRLRREVSRIENLDAQTRSKQHNIETLTQTERDLAARITLAQENLDNIKSAITEKTDELQTLTGHLADMKVKTRVVLGL